MNIAQIGNNLQLLVKSINKDTFIFELLLFGGFKYNLIWVPEILRFFSNKISFSSVTNSSFNVGILKFISFDFQERIKHFINTSFKKLNLWKTGCHAVSF